MKTLSEYITNNEKIDGHIHLFDHRYVINDYKSMKRGKYVGFMDIDFNHLNKYDSQSVMQYYDNYIDKYYSKNITLLATATDSNTMIELYKKYPKIIKGFGEIKCYSKFNDNGVDKELPFGNLDWIIPLCEFNKNIGLPIYIHWYVFNYERKKELSDLLQKYSSIPFVLCHCGMSPFRDYKKQYELVVDLLLNNNNLFVDISYDCVFFFNENKEYLRPLFGKCLLGTDLNYNSFINNKSDKYIKVFNYLYNIDLNYKNTFIKLFK